VSDADARASCEPTSRKCRDVGHPGVRVSQMWATRLLMVLKPPLQKLLKLDSNIFRQRGLDKILGIWPIIRIQLMRKERA
jgi:hypothetical protein